MKCRVSALVAVLASGACTTTIEEGAPPGEAAPHLGEVTSHDPRAPAIASTPGVPLAPGEAEYGVQRTADGTPLRWPDGCVSFDVDAAGTRFVPADDELAALRRAAATWVTEIGGCSILSIDLRVQPDVISARDRRSTIVFRDDSWCRPATADEDEHCHSDQAIAVTRVRFVDDPARADHAEIQEADIEINSGGFALSVNGNTASTVSEVRDLEAVVAHELGHALGLAHNCWDGIDPTKRPADHQSRPVPRCDDAAAPASLADATMYFQFDGTSEDKADLEATDVLGGCQVTAGLVCERDVRAVGCSAGTSSPGWWWIGMLWLARRRSRRPLAWAVACGVVLAAVQAQAGHADTSSKSRRVLVKPFRGAPTKKVRTQMLDLVEAHWRLGRKSRDACAVLEGRVRERRLRVTVRDPDNRGAGATSFEIAINDAGRLPRKERASLERWLALSLGELCATGDSVRGELVDTPPDASTEPAAAQDAAPAPPPPAEPTPLPPITVLPERAATATPADVVAAPARRSEGRLARGASDLDARVALTGGVIRRSLDSSTQRHGVQASSPRIALVGEVVPLAVNHWLRIGFAGRIAWSRFAAEADGFADEAFTATHDSARLGVLARRGGITLSAGAERRRDRFSAMTPALVAVLPASSVDLVVLELAGHHDRDLIHLRGALAAAAVIGARELSGQAPAMQRAGELELSVGASLGRQLRVGLDASVAELRAETARLSMSDRRIALALTLGWVR